MRWIRPLILFGLLGAITTIAIAWGFAVATDRSPTYETFTGPAGLASIVPPQREKVYFGEGEWHSLLRTRTLAGDILRLDYMGGNPVYDPHTAPDDLPRWSLPRRSPRETYEAVTPKRSLHEEAWGWPLRALQSRTWLADDPTGLPNDIESTNGVVVRNSVTVAAGFVSGRDIRIIPLAPVWMGFIGNTALFAAAWWVLFSVLSMTRRRIRTRRGRCPRCAYDLRGQRDAGCSECGWGRIRSQSMQRAPRLRPAVGAVNVIAPE